MGITRLIKSESNDIGTDTAQKIKFSIKDFLSKCDQIRCFLWIYSHSLKEYLMENFIFCSVWNKKKDKADLQNY